MITITKAKVLKNGLLVTITQVINIRNNSENILHVTKIHSDNSTYMEREIKGSYDYIYKMFDKIDEENYSTIKK